MATTTYPSLSQRTNTWAAVDMLSHAEPFSILQEYGQHKPIPKNKADNAKFRRVIPFAKATTPLTEGVTPTAQALTYEDVSVTLAQYGGLAEITDHVQDMAEDPVLKDATEQCGEQAALTTEAIVWGVLQAGTNVLYANGTARNQVNDVISLAKQRGATRILKGQKGKKITSKLSSSVKYGTEPVDMAFIAFAHTDMESDIRDMTGFVPTEKYGSMKALKGEIGKVEDVRYILSPELDPIIDAGGLSATNTTVSTGGTNSDVYPVVYVAKEAFGCVALKGKDAITPKITPVDQTDSNDPLGQVGYVGWKTYFAALILNDAWMVRMECAAKDIV